MASITGFPERLPLKSGIWLADYFGGLMGAVGVLGALSYRDRTGEGQYIRYSQVENLMRVLDWTWLWQGFTGEARGRSGNRDVAICPRGHLSLPGCDCGHRGSDGGPVSWIVQSHGKARAGLRPSFLLRMERACQEENAVVLPGYHPTVGRGKNLCRNRYAGRSEGFCR